MKKLYRVELTKSSSAVAYVAAESEDEAEKIALQNEYDLDWEDEWGADPDTVALADSADEIRRDGWGHASPYDDDTDTSCLDWLKTPTEMFKEVAPLPDPRQIVLGAAPPPRMSPCIETKWIRFNRLLARVHRDEELSDAEGAELVRIHEDKGLVEAARMIRRYQDSL